MGSLDWAAVGSPRGGLDSEPEPCDKVEETCRDVTRQFGVALGVREGIMGASIGR